MSGAAWIKFFPSDWLTGTIGLSAVEKGVYITILALIYDKGGPIPNNPKVLARRCETTPQAFAEAFQTLVEEGKLIVDDLEIFNEKAEKIIADAESRIRKASNAGKARQGIAKQKQGEKSAQAEHKISPEPSKDEAKHSVSLAIPELELELDKKKASKLAQKDDEEGDKDNTLEAELRHAAGWHHDAQRLSHVKPIADLIAVGLSLHEDVIPTVRQLAPNATSRTSWNYFIGPLADILARRKAERAQETIKSATPESSVSSVWVWKGTPQWDAWSTGRSRPWPTSEKPHPEGGRRAGWYFPSEWPPTPAAKGTDPPSVAA